MTTPGRLATRHLAALLCASAMLLASAAAQAQPCAACAAGGSACSDGRCTDGTCGCQNGQPCHCGTDCRCGRDTQGNSEPMRWSDEWYARRAHLPFASSQKCKHGLAYPPYPRPPVNADFSTKCHAAHYWPHPYTCWDRGYARQVMGTQVANGWAQATTLYGYHFDAETGRLNDAGQYQLRWILQQAPAQQRVVYVQPLDDRTSSEDRLASVVDQVRQMTGDDSVPVALRGGMSHSRPAAEVDAIRRAESLAIPQPRLPFSSFAGGGAGAR